MQKKICPDCGFQNPPDEPSCKLCGQMLAATTAVELSPEELILPRPANADTAFERQPPESAASGCLLIILALVVIHSSISGACWFLAAVQSESGQGFPPLIGFAMNLAVLVFAIATFRLHKWGVVGLAASYGIFTLIYLALGEWLLAIQAIVPAAVVLFLARDSWPDMK